MHTAMMLPIMVLAATPLPGDPIGIPGTASPSASSCSVSKCFILVAGTCPAMV